MILTHSGLSKRKAKPFKPLSIERWGLTLQRRVYAYLGVTKQHWRPEQWRPRLITHLLRHPCLRQPANDIALKPTTQRMRNHIVITMTKRNTLIICRESLAQRPPKNAPYPWNPRLRRTFFSPSPKGIQRCVGPSTIISAECKYWVLWCFRYPLKWQ